ncbi:MAG: exosortase/archaeosortase family protein [Synergistaceae bacterium]|nr:exosortase/archaeosortase family protein [Synergistaceae bacterium]
MAEPEDPTVRRFAPLAAALAGWSFWPWLWGRWFGVGGALLQGCMFFLMIIAAWATGLRREVGTEPLWGAGAFLVATRVSYPFIPRLLSAALFFSALYWTLRTALPPEERKGRVALWPLLLLCLPLMPSAQFVLGYPLRLLAARLATLALPGTRAVGCGLTDGVVEVFVDAPCAGAGMLYGMLLLAAGVGFVFRLEARRVVCLLCGGVVLALWANASRAVLLFAAHANILPVSLARYESTVGLFYFTVGGLLLTAAARWMSVRAVGSFSRKVFVVISGFWSLIPAHDYATRYKNKSRGLRSRLSEGKGPRQAAAFFLAACAFTGLSGGEGVSSRHEPSLPVLWPLSWEGRQLSDVPASPETALFWRDFPGACQEFAIQSEDDGGFVTTEDRLVLRFVREATRRLHPAEDCFRGAGYGIKPLPLLLDGDGRRWSVFTAEKAGLQWTVRQCVISVPDEDLRRAEKATQARSWPDVAAWYWDTARPGFSTPALAITVIQKP